MSLVQSESEESLIDIGYPLKLSDSHIKNNADTSITETDMCTLQNVRRILSKKCQQYALEFYVDFFSEHDEMINRFRNPTTDKLEPIIMSKHRMSIFTIFRDIVELGLKNWPKVIHRISGVSKCHVAGEVTLNEIQVMANAMKELVLKKCDGLISPSVAIACEKLLQECFQQHAAREMTAKDDISEDSDD